MKSHGSKEIDQSQVRLLNQVFIMREQPEDSFAKASIFSDVSISGFTFGGIEDEL